MLSLHKTAQFWRPAQLWWLSWKAPAAKPEALSGDVRCIRRVRRAQWPPSVPLQPPKQVIASPLLFSPVPQLPQVHLVHSQVQGTVHLWTQEERIQNTLQNTLAPRYGRKPRMGRQLSAVTPHFHTQTTYKNVFQRHSAQILQKNILFIIKLYQHKK